MALRLNNMRRVMRGAPAAVDRGVHRAATYVKDLAVQLAPEDTGDLKASGAVEPGEPNGGARYRVVFSVPYARYVEFGNDNPNYPAQPFLHPAKKEISVRDEVKAELVALIRGGA